MSKPFSVGTTINAEERCAAYPTMIRIRNLGSGTARVYALLNVTTGVIKHLDIDLKPGEKVEIK